MSKGKIHPGGVSRQGTGPVFTTNSPLKFHGAGKTSGKIVDRATIDHQVPGATLIHNGTPVNLPKANSTEENRVIGTRDGHFKLTDTTKTGVASGGSGYRGDAGLKSSYEKKGKTMSHKPPSIF
jgi:hypothetical protein